MRSVTQAKIAQREFSRYLNVQKMLRPESNGNDVDETSTPTA